jgi:hypothetical protein
MGALQAEPKKVGKSKIGSDTKPTPKITVTIKEGR